MNKPNVIKLKFPDMVLSEVISERDALQAKLTQLQIIQQDWGVLSEERLEYENNINTLQAKLDIALEALQEIYKRYEHGRGSGAGMVANRALKKLEE